MREFCWDDGFYFGDGHCWCLGVDFAVARRVDTGERVVLRPPALGRGSRRYLPAPVECVVYLVPETGVYVAIGEGVRGYLSVIFFDMISLERLQNKVETEVMLV